MQRIKPKDWMSQWVLFEHWLNQISFRSAGWMIERMVVEMCVTHLIIAKKREMWQHKKTEEMKSNENEINKFYCDSVWVSFTSLTRLYTHTNTLKHTTHDNDMHACTLMCKYTHSKWIYERCGERLSMPNLNLSVCPLVSRISVLNLNLFLLFVSFHSIARHKVL